MRTVSLRYVIPAIEPDVVIAHVVVVVQLEGKAELCRIFQVDVRECPAIQSCPIPPADWVILDRAHHIHICRRLKICQLQGSKIKQVEVAEITLANIDRDVLVSIERIRSNHILLFDHQDSLSHHRIVWQIISWEMQNRTELPILGIVTQFKNSGGRIL